MQGPETTRDERRGVARLEAFSDGVYAIAITLLVLGIEVPDVSEQALGSALEDLLPSVLAYFLGFAVIGIFWLNHHRFFADVERHDTRLLWTNLLHLSFVAAMPFSTGLIGEFGGTQAGAIIFAANVSAASLAAYLSEYEAIRSGLLRPKSALAGRPLISWSLVTPLVFALSIPLTFVSVSLAEYSWVLAILGARDR
ncbi:MAG TPA: TMEM175 family protein [Solirubrobacterales bacterium]|nr:TMEM175 family protein [Solirubrobacterales bacterium]